MKIVAIQLDAKFADVRSNLISSEGLIKQACSLGAELVLLPEFFTSAIGFSKQMLNVPSLNKQVHDLLTKWAAEYNIIIGGSYLSLENNNVYNLFELVFQNGETYQHKKDIPTQFENCYYTNGDQNNVLITPIGNIGIALCWEMIRYDTLRRMAGKVDIVLAASCWWDLPEDAPLDREPLRKYNQNLALETPVEFAKLVQVPVVHANHCGKVTANHFPNANKIQTRQFVGATQIMNENGYVLERREFAEGEGFVFADLIWDTSKRRKAKAYPEKYWIPSLPDSYINAWETINPQAANYYETIAVQHYSNRAFSEDMKQNSFR